MAEYLSPGVYVEEVDSAPRAIEGVGTSTAGFVGMTVKGPVGGAPAYCPSMAEFTRQYGGFLSEYTHGEYRYLPLAVEQFFANGGTRCFISRVVPADAKCAQAKSGVLSISAANPGKWGNRVVMTFETVNRRKFQVLEHMDGAAYRVKTISGFGEGDLVVCGGELNRIEGVFDNMVTFVQPFETDIVDTALVPKTVVYSVEMDVQVRYEGDGENYAGVNLDPASSNYLANRITKSDLVQGLALDAVDGLVNPVSAILGEGKTSGVLVFAGGSDGTQGAVDAGTYIGTDEGPGKRTGIQAFLENNVVSIMAVPGITLPEVVISLVAHCENTQSRFAIIDIPQDLKKTGEILEYREMIDSTFAAMYHPWVQVFDPISRKPGYCPPSGSVAGVYSRTDVRRGVHKAPANETIACSGLSIGFTTGEQDILNPAGVNLIRAMPGQGIRIWGARTASSNASFKYVNVRRLFIYVEQSIKVATNWVVFEPNTAVLWNRVRMTIDGFLNGIFRAGMLFGEAPGEAYFVEIGPNTMTRDDIANGRLICEIGIAPSRPAEFVIFRVSQFTAGGGE